MTHRRPLSPFVGRPLPLLFPLLAFLALLSFTLPSPATPLFAPLVAEETGYVIESAPGSNVGGAVSNGVDGILVGAGVSGQRSRGILSFDTSALPTAASILRARLRLRLRPEFGAGEIGEYSSFHIEPGPSGGFGGSSTLDPSDWEAPGGGSGTGATLTAPESWTAFRWFELDASGFDLIGREGRTQYRLSLEGVPGGGQTAEAVSFGDASLWIYYDVGDVNDDTWIDRADAQLIEGHLLGLAPLSEEGVPSPLARADANADMRVDVADVVTITNRLVRPPSPEWSRLLGGTTIATGNGVCLDLSGNVYVVGMTWGSDSWTSGGYDTTSNGARDAFIASLDASGNHRWSGVMGGYNEESARAVAVDADGSVYVGGETSTPDWVGGGCDTQFAFPPPSWPNPIPPTDAFIVKLSPTGDHLWSTYIGGDGFDKTTGLALDQEGNLYAVGQLLSAGWEFDAEGDTIDNGLRNAFVVKLTANGELEWVTFMGGMQKEGATSIAIGRGDSGTVAYVAGWTLSGGWASGDPDPFADNPGAFVQAVSGTGGLLWCTFLPEELRQGELETGIVLHDDALFLASGVASQFDWLPRDPDPSDAMVARLTLDGDVVWKKRLGGSDGETAGPLAIAGDNSLVMAGASRSFGWVDGGYDPYFALGPEPSVAGYLVNLTRMGSHRWSTYVEGAQGSFVQIHACGAAADGRLVLVGSYYAPGDQYDALVVSLR